MLNCCRHIPRWTMALLIGTIVIGCQNWRVDPQAIAQPVPERRRLQIWTGGESHIVQGVRIQGDSIRAVPYWRPADCDSCAVYFRRSAIDSIRVARVNDLHTGLAIGAFTVLSLFLLMLSQAMSGMQT